MSANFLAVGQAPIVGQGRGANAITVRDGRIAAIGHERSLRTTDLPVVETPGGVLSPYFHDHHFHPIGYVSAVTRPSLKGAGDFAGIADLLRERTAGLDPGSALIANRLDDEMLTERRLPQRTDLDAMVGDRPVLLHRYCGHVAVANTAALRLAGQPSDGDGILREEQIQAVSTAVAARQAPIDPATARQVLAGLVSLGLGRLTAIVSATDPLWCEVPDEIGTLLEVGRDIPLDFDVLIIASKPEHLDEAAARIDSSPGRFTFLGLKDFADGSLGGRTAALYEPYTDDPANRGVVRLVPERTAPVARRCLEMGGTVAIHAIGDVANDRVLDLFEDLIAAGADPARLRIEHASVLTGEGLDRMANLGVTASVQPAFITSETSWLGARLGARVSRTYALGRMTAKGIPLVGGSDCPVEAPDPFAGMAAAAGPEGLTPEQALALFSQPLRVGDAADFIVLDRDPMGSAGSAGTKVLAAFRAGREVTLTPETPFR